MAFSRPRRTGAGSAYLPLKELTEDEGTFVLVAFRVLDFRQSERGDYPDRPVWPVVADAMIVGGQGPAEDLIGRIFKSKEYRYAITNALRGAPSESAHPTTKIGEEIIVRAERNVDRRGKVGATVWGNDPTDAQLDEGERTFDLAGGWSGGWVPDPENETARVAAGPDTPDDLAPQPAEPAPEPARRRDPVGARAGTSSPARTSEPGDEAPQASGSGSSRPWNRRR